MVCSGLGCEAGVAQLVELQFSKLNVASSSLVARSKHWVWVKLCLQMVICSVAHVAQW